MNDIRILTEMRSFTHTDADELGSSRVGHFTKHFDLLMSASDRMGDAQVRAG